MNETLTRGKSIASFALGIVSLLCGFTLIAPVIGLILGVVGRKNEPAGKTLATWGIVLNILALVGWIILTIVLVGTGVIAAFLHPQM